MADQDPTPDNPAPEADPPEPEPEPDDVDTEEPTQAEPGDAESAGVDWRRRGLVAGGVVAVVVVCAVVLVALRSGDEDPAEPTTTTSEPGDEGDEAAATAPPSGPPAGVQEPVAGVAGLEPVDGEPWEPDDVAIGGTTYGDTLVSGPIGGCEDGATRDVTYELGGRYTRLDGTLGLADDSAPGVTVEIGFSLDGDEVYWRSFVQGEASRIQLDLTGAQRLTVTAARVFGGDIAPEACARAAHGDLSLT